MHRFWRNIIKSNFYIILYFMGILLIWTVLISSINNRSDQLNYQIFVRPSDPSCFSYGFEKEKPPCTNHKLFRPNYYFHTNSKNELRGFLLSSVNYEIEGQNSPSLISLQGGKMLKDVQ